ncbi:MAG: gephyrin-like molybdotransferase Glp [Planctomycetota bacterium]
MREFFQVADVEEARAQALGFASVGSGRVPLEGALGRVLAADVVAAADLPGFSRSTMDGFAVRASSTFGASDGAPALLAVVGSVEMGRSAEVVVGPGEAAGIPTGGMLPKGADAVVMVEHTEPVDESTVEVMRSVAPGANVIGAADDARAGDTALERGTRLRPPEVGLLAALGVTEVEVFDRPRVAILSTGDEVVPAEETPGPGRVRDVNRHSLGAFVESCGGVALPRGIVPDEFDALLEACRAACDLADVVLISGGSSVGARDLTIEVLEALPESRVLLHGVAMRPGKPTILADVAGRPVWGLPGHVASAMVVFSVLVRPQIEHLGGATRRRSVLVPATLTRNLASAHGRREFVRVRLRERDGTLRAEPVPGRSGLVRTMVGADGLIEIGRDVEGLFEGSVVRVELF